ncbi:hypothetical protein [Mycolicibacterium insubricum]|uniref:hypothetical protein n=1 Tax=Mycolicibacterium insubricum TaxID=444597 RepID=UPI0021F317C6|nr:hypothetical protein [Mycolicibacterium insubricum]MCV7080318.1 hypothetical protein [Mycolicibacterium insubricum]
MPEPEHLGPLGAHLVAEEFTACRGRVIFAGGSEVAVIDEPRLIEVVRGDDVPAPLLKAATTTALVPAEANQVSGGGSNARFGALFDHVEPGEPAATSIRSCALVADDSEVAAALSQALAERGVTCHPIAGPSELAEITDLDAVVIAPTGTPAADHGAQWERILAEHDGIVERCWPMRGGRGRWRSSHGAPGTRSGW